MLDTRYIMGQIRNVIFIIIATAIMAVLTSVITYFFDYLTTNLSMVSTAKFLVTDIQNIPITVKVHI